MDKLISGKDAKIAWASGECVEFRNTKDKWYEDWTNLYDAKNGFSIQEFGDSNYEFRIKHKTILLNDVEIPAPFKPKKEDVCWYLSPYHESGYSHSILKELGGELQFGKCTLQFGVWDSEEKIKEVVKAVYNAFNCGDDE